MSEEALGGLSRGLAELARLAEEARRALEIGTWALVAIALALVALAVRAWRD